MADPARAERHGQDPRALRRSAGGIRAPRRLRARERRRAKCCTGSASTTSAIDGDVGELSGGWKMRVAMARVLLGRPDVLLMDEPTNHLDIESIIWLESFLKSLPGALLMTSHDREFMNRLVTKIAEIDDGEIIVVLRQLRFLRARARDPRGEPRGGVRAAAGDARQGAALHRAVRGARRQGRAGAEPREGARQDRKDRAAEEAARREVRFPQPPRSGDQVVTLGTGAEGLRPPRRARRRQR